MSAEAKKQLFWVDSYALVDKLVAQDGAYVDTDIMPNPLFAFEMNVKFRANSNVNGPGNVYFGCANDLVSTTGQGWETAHNPEAWTGFGTDASYCAIQSFNDRKIRFKPTQHMFWQQNGSTTNPTPDAWHVVKMHDYTGGTTPPLCEVDGINFPLALNSTSSNSDIPRAPICVFAIAEADKRHRCCAYPGTAMRWLKFWNVDNELVHELRAATSGKRIGLVDLCTSKFYEAINCEVTQ